MSELPSGGIAARRHPLTHEQALGLLELPADPDERTDFTDEVAATLVAMSAEVGEEGLIDLADKMDEAVTATFNALQLTRDNTDRSWAYWSLAERRHDNIAAAGFGEPTFVYGDPLDSGVMGQTVRRLLIEHQLGREAEAHGYYVHDLEHTMRGAGRICLGSLITIDRAGARDADQRLTPGELEHIGIALRHEAGRLYLHSSDLRRYFDTFALTNEAYNRLGEPEQERYDRLWYAAQRNDDQATVVPEAVFREYLAARQRAIPYELGQYRRYDLAAWRSLRQLDGHPEPNAAQNAEHMQDVERAMQEDVQAMQNALNNRAKVHTAYDAATNWKPNR